MTSINSNSSTSDHTPLFLLAATALATAPPVNANVSFYPLPGFWATAPELAASRPINRLVSQVTSQINGAAQSTVKQASAAAANSAQPVNQTIPLAAAQQPRISAAAAASLPPTTNVPPAAQGAAPAVNASFRSEMWLPPLPTTVQQPRIAAAAASLPPTTNVPPAAQGAALGVNASFRSEMWLPPLPTTAQQPRIAAAAASLPPTTNVHPATEENAKSNHANNISQTAPKSKKRKAVRQEVDGQESHLKEFEYDTTNLFSNMERRRYQIGQKGFQSRTNAIAYLKEHPGTEAYTEATLLEHEADRQSRELDRRRITLRLKKTTPNSDGGGGTSESDISKKARDASSAKPAMAKESPVTHIPAASAAASSTIWNAVYAAAAAATYAKPA